MYAKLFAKILDSSIWLEDDQTRLVWITLLAAMDEDGFAQFSAIGNLANRARVTVEQAEHAVDVLTSPDRANPGQDHEGRRIERVPGGFMVLKAKDHAAIINRAEQLRQNRERVQRHREMKRSGNAPVMELDQPVDVDQSVPTQTIAVVEDGFDAFWSVYPKKVGKGLARAAWHKIKPSGDIIGAVERQKRSAAWLREGGRYIPNPSTWLNQQRWDDEPDPEVPVLTEKNLNNLRAGEAFIRGDYDRK